MTDTTGEKYSVDVGVGRHLGARLRVAPGESDSGVAVVEHTLPPRKLAAPLHRHSREDELSYILEGEMGIQEGDEVSTVGAGEVAVKERGVWHTFWNPGPEPLRFLEIIAPGEFAWYFREVADLLPADGDPDEATMARIEDLHGEYGFEIDYGSVPDLIERHGLER
ncbi:cupin domain-containing protein [Halobacteriales archaeon QS_1_68_17]|nr:MAG: cupin domain-containing protein [Halobacteriales archaeon QS_1_68_17]